MKYLLVLVLLASPAWSQVRVDITATTTGAGQFGASIPLLALPGAIVSICGSPPSPAASSGQACTNYVPIFSDRAMTVPITQPITADAGGRFGFYIASGTYSDSIKSSARNFIRTDTFTAQAGTGAVGGNFSQISGIVALSQLPTIPASQVSGIPAYTSGACISITQVGTSAQYSVVATCPLIADGTSIVINPTTGVASSVVPIASASVLGGIKPDGTSIMVNPTTGIASAPAATPYNLPIAGTATLGGIVPDGVTIITNPTTGSTSVSSSVGSGLPDPGFNGIVTRTAVRTTGVAAYGDVEVTIQNDPRPFYLECGPGDGTAIPTPATGNGAFTCPLGVPSFTNSSAVTYAFLTSNTISPYFASPPAAIGSGTPVAGTFTAVTDAALTSGNCVQAGTGGALTTTAGPCSSGGGTFPATTNLVAGTATANVGSNSGIAPSNVALKGSNNNFTTAQTALQWLASQGEISLTYSATRALNPGYLTNTVALTGAMSVTMAAGTAGQAPVCLRFLKSSTSTTYAITYPSNMLGGGQPANGYLRATQCFTWIPSATDWEAVNGPMFNY